VSPAFDDEGNLMPGIVDVNAPPAVQRQQLQDQLLAQGFNLAEAQSLTAQLAATAELLGISFLGRQRIIYITTQDISVLRSSAADTTKNLSFPETARGSGGGIQFFTNNRDAFQPFGQ
jgi:hypothetical protein